MGTIRAISHLLAAVVSNASEFKRRWHQDLPPPRAANGLQGRWLGEWISEANGHRGALRCVLLSGADGLYKATFHAVFGGILRVCYSVPLHGQWCEGKLKLEGEADLGPLAGGIYGYRGEADEREFVCEYKCKYDHGTFRMKPSPQNESRPASHRRLLLWCPIAAVLIFGAIVAISIVVQRPREAYYQGRSASSWLREFSGPKAAPDEALEAFKKMGSDAEPVLLAALSGRENMFVHAYRSLCASMPELVERNLPKPENPELLRMAAVIVLRSSSSRQIIADLYPMFKIPDTATRLAVLRAVENQVPHAGEISLMVQAGDDPDPYFRSELWHRLGLLGPLGAPAAPYVLKFCGESNIDVRAEAAWTLWRITAQTNTALPVLESVLSQQQDANHRHSAAYHLLLMGDSTPFFVTTLINSLTNSEAADRATVCTFLGEIKPPAAAAIPALRKALHDPEPGVRRRAEVALSNIQPKTN